MFIGSIYIFEGLAERDGITELKFTDWRGNLILDLDYDDLPDASIAGVNPKEDPSNRYFDSLMNG